MDEKDKKDELSERKEAIRELEDLLERIKSEEFSDLQSSIDKMKVFEDKLYPVLKEKFKKGAQEDKKAILKVMSRLNKKKYASFLKDILLKQILGLDIIKAAFDEQKDLDIPEGEMIKASLPTAEEIYDEVKGMIDIPSESLNVRFAMIKDCFVKLDHLVQKNFLFQFISDFKGKSLPIISSLIGISSELDNMIIDLLPHIESEDAAKFLKKMMETTDDKERKKLIKRSIFKLKSKGIKIEEPEKGETVWTPMPKTPAPKWEGYLGAIDCIGTRVVWIVSPIYPRVLNMAYAILNDSKGILDFYCADLSRKEFKSFFKEYSEKEKNFAIVEADPKYCHFLIEKGRSKTVETGKNPPDDYLYWKNRVKPKKVENLRPLIYSYFKEEIEKILSLVDKSYTLHTQKEFMGWFIEKDDIEKYKDMMESSTSGLIILSPLQQKERMEEIIKKATEEYFDEQRAQLYKERLEEMAYILYKVGKENEARLSLASALAIERKEILIANHPFLRELMRKSINLILSEKKDKKGKDESSLIIKP